MRFCKMRSWEWNDSNALNVARLARSEGKITNGMYANFINIVHEE